MNIEQQQERNHGNDNSTLAWDITRLNRQRLGGYRPTVSEVTEEKVTMQTLLAQQLECYSGMDISDKLPGPIRVNPELIEFLDGMSASGGYADYYEKIEYEAPGTVLEMELEKRIIREHIRHTLVPDLLNGLRKAGKPLVLVEGGAGPDLRTYGTVCDALSARRDDLIGIPIKIIISDISTRMAALTAAKIEVNQSLKQGMDIETSVIHADIFDVMAGLKHDTLSYVLLPFGIVSFGINGKDTSSVLSDIRSKMVEGAGTLITVYHSGWLTYTDQLRKILSRTGLGETGISDISPFVIDIVDDHMQVGGGKAFPCRPYDPDELVDIVSRAGLTDIYRDITPAGWAYMPTDVLKRSVNGSIASCAPIPSVNDMDTAKSVLIAGIRRKGGNDDDVKILEDLIPSGEQMLAYPAPYVTVTANNINK